MKSVLLGAASAAVLLASLSAAPAQTTITRETTTTPGGQVTLSPTVRTKVREYVVQHRRPSVTIQERVAVGTVLPPSAQFFAFDGMADVGPYRYAYVNDAPVLVDPGSRRIIEVIE
jgi:opacity protein-like surface antigen